MLSIHNLPARGSRSPDGRRLVQDLAELVRIPSHEECDTIAAHVVAVLKKDGATEVRRDEGGNVIAVFGEGGPGLLVNAHLDTVPPGKFQGDPYAAEIRDGRLIGRGASDDKSCVATMLELARCLRTAPLRQQVTLAFTVWEESTRCGENGSYRVATEAQAARCLVLDSDLALDGSAMTIDAGCKGIMNLHMTVHGKSCHSSVPEKGQNAIYRANDFLQRFRGVFDPATMPHREYRLGRRRLKLAEVATVTEIEARQGVNVIPSECHIAANCRLLPDGDETEIIRRLKKLVAEFPKGWVTWKSKVILGHLCQDAELTACCQAAIRQAGLRPRLGIAQGRTDSTIFQNVGGMQSVIMGTGTDGTAHTDNEFVVLDHFVKGTAVIVDLVRGLTCR